MALAAKRLESEASSRNACNHMPYSGFRVWGFTLRVEEFGGNPSSKPLEQNMPETLLGVSEIRGSLIGVPLMRESYYLGTLLGVPDFRKPP